MKNLLSTHQQGKQESPTEVTEIITTTKYLQVQTFISIT